MLVGIMNVMKTKSWGITHNIFDDIILISIYGIFKRDILKAYLSKILQGKRTVNSFIFQMNVIYVPTENDFSELIECVRHLTVIKRIAIIAAAKFQETKAESSLGYLIPENMRVKICFDGHSAIDWAIK